MPEVVELPRTARRSTQLVAASARALDPFVEVDWSRPIDDAAYHLPPECLPLVGTPAWDRMGERERVRYSRHEAAAFYGALVAFENLLMRAVLHHLAELPVTHPAHRYLLIEVAEECRHSAMFGEFIRRGGTPPYRPSTAALDNLEQMPGGWATVYTLILAVEEYFDATNRLCLRDERLHATAREIARVHATEEARHVSFARTYIAEVWPQFDGDQRRELADFAPRAVALVVDLMVVPEVYETLGIEGGRELVLANPRHRARVDRSLARLGSFLLELGVIDDEHRDGWCGLGLGPAAP